MRERKIDIFRSIAMIWVILIHSLFWTSTFMPGVKGFTFITFLLFEMPLFFFVAGASNSFSTKSSTMKFYFSRFQRILIPYWIYSAFCVVLTLLLYSDRIENVGKFIVNWIVPMNKQSSPLKFLSGALWFIPIYLMTMIVFPLLRKFYTHKKSRYVKYLPIVATPIIMGILDVITITKDWHGSAATCIKSFVFYSFWIYLGMFYKQLFTKKKVAQGIVLVVVSCIVFILLGKSEYYTFNMQENKGPTSLIFFVFSLIDMGILYLLSDFIVAIYEKLAAIKLFRFVLEQYQRHCFTIYLFHQVSLQLIYAFLQKTNAEGYLASYPIIKVLFYFLTSLVLSAILGKVFGFIENIKINPSFLRKEKTPEGQTDS